MNTDTVHTIAQLSPRASVRRTTDQTIPDATTTAIDYGAAADVVGTGLSFSASASTVLTVKVAGLYLVVGEVGWALNATGRRDLWVYKGSSGVAISRVTPMSGIVTYQTVVALVPLAIRDTLSLWVRQTSGGNLALLTSSFTPKLSAVRVGP